MLTACSTTSVGLKYAPSTATVKPISSALGVFLGNFVDKRDVGPNWIGAARITVGVARHNLETNQPVSTLFQKAFEAGLRYRGISINYQSPSLQISGVIHELYCGQHAVAPSSRLSKIEAKAEIEISVTEIISGKQRFNRKYSALNIVDGPGWTFCNGFAASGEDLFVPTEKTFRDVIDKILDDSDFRAALQ
jgi:uncharacterized lipoprotein YajG